ncbi:MAG: hypothetical protein IT429_16260 [Gemmataceae bacterium]|nr:hypothetical protein [Gemmataceae bacterium]
MGRFLLTLILALGIGGIVAWYCELGPFAPEPTTSAAHASQRDAAVAKLGDALYRLPVPVLQPLDDEPVSRRQVVIPDCLINSIDKQDIAAAKDGIILFIGELVESEEILGQKNLPTAQILVGGKPTTLTYRRWKDGDIIESGRMVALVDPTKAMNDRLFKQAKIVAAIADHTAAVATAKEAEARLERAKILRQARIGNVISEEEYAAAVLTRDKYVQEEVAKREAVNLTRIEADQAVAELRQHEIRNMFPGKSIIKMIYKHMGEGVKNFEPVMHLYSISRLRVEGSVESQYADLVKQGMRVIVEPTHETAPLPLIKAHRGEINSVAISFDRKQPTNPRFISASEDRTVCVWRRNQEGAPEAVYVDSPVRVVACSPPASGRSLFVAGTADGRIFLGDLDNPRDTLREIKDAHTDAVTALAFSPDGKYFASSGQDNRMLMWETASAKLLYPFDHEHGVDNPHQGIVTALTFTPQGKLISAGRDNTLRVWNLHKEGARLDGRPILGRGGSVQHPGVSADGKLMIFDQGRTLQLLSTDKHRTMAVLQNPAATPFETLAQFSPDGTLLLTAGGTEGRMQLWRTPTPTARGYEVRQFVTTERSPVTCAAFAPDGTFAVSGTKDGYVHLWPVPTREEVKNHRIRVNEQRQPLTVTHVDRTLDASKLRLTVNLDNPETPEYPSGRLMPGRRVTLVVEQP